MLTFIDWFAGIGGFRRGMELAGHKCVGFCEFDKFAAYSYKAMHLTTDAEKEILLGLNDYKKAQKYIDNIDFERREWYARDVRAVSASDIPRADVWCFGFPCQDISIAGKQRGLAGNRSGLFNEIIRLIKGKKEDDKPKWLFLENVRNLLSVSGGWDLARVLTALDEVGYDAEWSIVNSSDVVAQNRERIYIVGCLRGQCGRKVFPIGKSDRETSGIQGQCTM